MADIPVPPETDYRWWLTGATVPADWLAKVTYAMHVNGAEQCDCASGDEHQFLLESYGDTAVFALEAVATLVAAAEQARIAEAAEAAAFTLFRPGLGNGPAHGQSMRVVPLSELRGLIGDPDA